jgi:PAS domain S-box-containing protein
MKRVLESWLHHELFEQVPCNIAIIDRDYTIVDHNRRFEDLFGPGTGRFCYEVYKKRDRICEACIAAKTFADRKVRESEEEGVDRRGKPAYYLVHVAPIVAPSGEIPYIIEMSTDITRLHQLEQEKIEAERLAAVGQIVAGLSHGIKNVISGLEGGWYVFKGGLSRNDQPRIQRGWEMLDRNITRIAALTRSLLSFSRGKTSNVSMVDPAELAAGVVDQFRESAREQGVELKVETAGRPAPAPFDPQGLEDCLANLVSNAVDACLSGSNGGCGVTVRCREEEETIVFEVEDRGCGMDEDIKKRIFRTSFTTKPAAGKGLGLLLARQVTREHGGEISFESSPGKGTVFTLTFPRRRLPALSKP